MKILTSEFKINYVPSLSFVCIKNECILFVLNLCGISSK